MTTTLPPLTASVLVADDHALVRDGLKLLITGVWPQAQFLDAYDAQSLFSRAAHQPPPCLALVDLNMPGMDKGARLTDLARAHPQLPVVVVSALTSPDTVRRALALSNVWAFVPKSSPAEHMRAAMRSALLGIKLSFAPPDATVSPELLLHPRLEEIRVLLRQGMSNKMIASQLGITEGTVKNYMSDIFKALNVSNRTQAARFDSDSA